MEIASLVLSIIAIILTIINLLYLLITNKKKIDLNIRNYTFKKLSNKDETYFYLFDVVFINKSRQPIAITSIQIIDGDKEYNIELKKQRVADRQKTRGTEVIERDHVDSAEFPINLTSLTAIREILIMHGDKDFEEEKVKIIINTNRGKVIRKIAIKEKYCENNVFTKKSGLL